MLAPSFLFISLHQSPILLYYLLPSRSTAFFFYHTVLQEDEMSVDSQSVGTVGEAPQYAYNIRVKVSKLAIYSLDPLLASLLLW